MKHLTCEMCGSTDLIKQDGVFVCQTCGCKYSIEEARKMMVEGVVEVTGKVKIDDSEKIKKLYVLARRANEENNTEMAAKYYEQILLEDPMSWEASFYSTYFAALKADIDNVEENMAKIRASAKTALGIVAETETDIEKIRLAICYIVLNVSTFISKYFKPCIVTIYNYRNNNMNPPATLERAVVLMADTITTLSVEMYKNFGDIPAIDNNGKTYRYRSWIDPFWGNGKTLFKSLIDCEIITPAEEYNRTKECYAVIQELEERIKVQEAERVQHEKEAIQKRFDDYWAEHAEEKASLESEKEGLSSQICALNTSSNNQVATLNKEIAAITGKAEIDNIEARIKKLTEEKSALGLFKVKEKKALQEQISQANAEKKSIQDRMDAAKKEIEAKIESVKAEIQRKITPLQNRVNTISNELTKAR